MVEQTIILVQGPAGDKIIPELADCKSFALLPLYTDQDESTTILHGLTWKIFEECLHQGQLIELNGDGECRYGVMLRDIRWIWKNNAVPLLVVPPAYHCDYTMWFVRLRAVFPDLQIACATIKTEEGVRVMARLLKEAHANE